MVSTCFATLPDEILLDGRTRTLFAHTKASLCTKMGVGKVLVDIHRLPDLFITIPSI